MTSESELAPEIVSEPLLYPRNGDIHLITTNEEFETAINQIAKGTGPIAIDAERASGYRYSQRAYLIQIYRRGGGLHLIDPISADSQILWSSLNEKFADEEWIIHASTQDLPCLNELGLYPQKLFDTELGGRIAGCERVGLGPLAQSLLNLSLAKEHSAVDWSIRPLKDEWLTYAALDVDVLVDLRDKVFELLESQNKLKWAQEDFAQIVAHHSPGVMRPARRDPWRRTSGMHKVRDRRTLAIIKGLWEARDSYASKIDIAPGRVFNDEVLVSTAVAKPKTVDELRRLLTRRTRLQNLPIVEWFEVVRTALALSADELPELRLPSTSLPPPKLWKDRNPRGYARLTHARAAVIERATELQMPAENLISPDVLRKLAWTNPPELTEDEFIAYVEDGLKEGGARPWQASELAPRLVFALQQLEPLEAPEPESAPESTPEM